MVLSNADFITVEGGSMGGITFPDLFEGLMCFSNISGGGEVSYKNIKPVICI